MLLLKGRKWQIYAVCSMCFNVLRSNTIEGTPTSSTSSYMVSCMENSTWRSKGDKRPAPPEIPKLREERHSCAAASPPEGLYRVI